jgi:hypothetical protein
MEKIEKSEWWEAAKEIGKENWPKRFITFGLCNCIISKDKQFLLIENVETAPRCMYYKVHMDIMREIYKSIRYLYAHDVMVRAGFYDKSMNTEIYESLAKKSFDYNGMQFYFDELRNLMQKLENKI